MVFQTVKLKRDEAQIMIKRSGDAEPSIGESEKYGTGNRRRSHQGVE